MRVFRVSGIKSDQSSLTNEEVVSLILNGGWPHHSKQIRFNRCRLSLKWKSQGVQGQHVAQTPCVSSTEKCIEVTDAGIKYFLGVGTRFREMVKDATG